MKGFQFIVVFATFLLFSTLTASDESNEEGSFELLGESIYSQAQKMRRPPRDDYAVGFLEVDHTLQDIEYCSATLINIYLHWFALTAASCLYNDAGAYVRSEKFVYLFPGYRKNIKEEPIPKAIIPDAIAIPSEWVKTKNPSYNYAFLYLSQAKMASRKIRKGDYATFAGFFTTPKGTPYTQKDIQEGRMTFGLYGQGPRRVGGKIIAYDPILQYLGTLLQQDYRIVNGIVYLGKTGALKAQNFWELGNPSARGSPLLHTNPTAEPDIPRLLGIMVDEGKILVITQEMYGRFLGWAKKKAHE